MTGANTELRQWVEDIADGKIDVPRADILDVVRNLLDEIDSLHDKYAHEGGIPQVMTAEIATKWIASLSIPSMWDIFQTATPNVFYASFQKTLFPDDKAQLKMLGFDAVVSDERFHARYMLKWNPPRSDEL
jgi:hypothetical protein